MNKNTEEYTECIRCGKTRILLKTWKDKGVNNKGSVVSYEQTVCPDRECQKVVDEKFDKMREMREASENRKKDIVIEKKALTAS